MALVRVGRPTFLRDSALSVLFGAVGVLPVVVVLALTDFPEWGETLLSFLVVFSAFFVVGLAIRGGLHLGAEYVRHGLREHGFDPDDDMPRSEYLRYSRPWLRFGAGSAGAAAVLVVAFLLGTGDTGW